MVKENLTNSPLISIFQYGHGYNSGGIIPGVISPAITTSSWQHNNFIMFKEHNTPNSSTIPVVNNYTIRKLTPRECFRLMDVRDTDIDKIREAGISKSQQYKLAGNSIVVNCLYLIFRNMFIPQHFSDKHVPVQQSLFQNL